MIRSRTQFLSKSRYNIYYFRLRIGDKEIKRSLKTRDIVEARIRLAQYMPFVKMANDGEPMNKLIRALDSIADDENKTKSAKDKINEKLSSSIALCKNQNTLQPFVTALVNLSKEDIKELDLLEAFRQYLDQHHTSDGFIKEALIGFKEISNTLVSPDHKLAEFRLKRLIDNLEHEHIKIHGKHFIENQVVPSRTLPRAHREPSMPSSTHSTIKCMADQFLRAYSDDKHKSKNTLVEYASSFDLLIEVFGKKPVHEITREDLEKLVWIINHLPSNRKKRKEYKNLPIQLAVERAIEKEGQEPLRHIIKTASVGKYLQHTQTLFKQNGHEFGFNPALEKSFTQIFRNRRFDNDSKGIKVGRRSFTSEELHSIFNGYLFNPKINSGKKRPKPYMFFCPLIALYTGARLNEIAQIHTDTIHQTDSGIWFFSVSKNSDRGFKAKNSSAERPIPLHPDLDQHGLFEYIQSRKMQAKRRGQALPLFDGLKHDPKNGYGRRVSAGFGSYLDHLGLTDKGLVFHSFRNTFINHYRSLGLFENEQDFSALKNTVGHGDKTLIELLGNSDGDITTHYAGTSRVEDIYERVILKLEVKRLLDLSHISWNTIQARYSL